MFCVLLELEFFYVILETPPFLLLLPKTFHLLDVFRLSTVCAKTSICLGNDIASLKQILR
jgi:hypothetical protein